jgi:hypothetical protein
MIIIDGIEVNTEADLEAAIINMDDASKTALRASFAGSPIQPLTTSPYKIWRYSNVGSPLTLDYVTGLKIKLHRKSTIVKGECTKEEFYVNYNGTTYSDLIVKEEHLFARDALGFAASRTTTVTWYLEDGTPSTSTKTWTKYYSNLEKIDEGKIRRGNLVDNLQMPCIGLISIAMIGTPNATTAVILEGRRFLADYKIEFDNFIGASDKTILACLNDSNHEKYISVGEYSWIDTMTPYGMTIRQYLVNELTI